MGGAWLSTEAEDVASAIVTTAEERQITQIVLGTSNRSSLHSLLRGSIIQQILRKAGDVGIDVHVIARKPDRKGGAGATEGD